MKKIFIVTAVTALFSANACSTKTSTPTDKDVVFNTNKMPEPAPNSTPGAPIARKSRERPNMNPNATPEPTEPRPAPENSEASVMMNGDGSITEFRVFKNHPEIAKVEANWTDPTSKNLKVFLKNGKILEATTDKIPTLRTARSNEIMKAVKSTGGGKADRPRIANGS